MARTEARIYTEIWEDPDFLALNPSAQRMFLFLVSQKDLAHDGVIALRERRWSKAAAGLTPDGVSRDLKELAATRFVIIDEDAEELLVRSFVRRDKVYRQPNVLRAAADHLPLVSSRAIRAEIHAELVRVIEAGGFVEASAKILDEMLSETGKGLGNPTRNPPEKGSGIPPENPTVPLPGEWGVVTGVTTEFPVPRSSKSPDPPTAGAVAPHADQPVTAQTLVAEWLNACAKRPPGPVIGQTSALLKKLLDEKQDPDDIRAGIRLWQEKGQHPSTLPSFVNQAMNASKTARAGRDGRRVSTEDDLRDWDRFTTKEAS